MEVVVSVEAASDFAAVFAVAGNEIFDGAAVGDVALAAAAHEQLGAGAVRFFQNQAAKTVVPRLGRKTRRAEEPCRAARR